MPRLIEIDVSQRVRAGEQPSPQDYQELLSEEELSRLSDIFEPEAWTKSTGTNALGRTWIEGGSQVQPAVREQIGRYRVLGILGEGAYGTVYRAFDDGPLAREVAIKVPRLGDAFDKARVTSLLKEARAAASLSHQNIVTVLDCGELDDGGCFVVFELIEGRHLGQEIRQGPLSIERAVDLMTQIASAVHHAHQTQNLFHRDLKPANILIAADGRPLVTDFGLAITDEQQLENRGEIMGTAAYMAPEQTRGEAHLLDGRADIWSLGVIFYEMLTAKRPFSGKSPPEIFEQIQHKDPRPLRQINDSIPHDVERVCRTCLQRDSSSRFQTALDLANALKRIAHRRKEFLPPNTALAARPTETYTPQPGQVAGAREIRNDNSPSPKNRQSTRRMLMLTIVTPLALALVYAATRPGSKRDPGMAIRNPPGEEAKVLEKRPQDGWQPLLRSPPVQVAWVPPEDKALHGFNHDSKGQSLTVRSPRHVWVFQTGIAAKGALLEIRGLLTMPDWVGCAGIVWALGEDETALEFTETCFALTIERTSIEEPITISLVQLTISDGILGFRSVRSTKQISTSIKIAAGDVPKTDSSVPFEAAIEEHSVQLKLNNESHKLILNTAKAKSLSPTIGAIGLSGFGSPISFKRVSQRVSTLKMGELHD